MRYVYFILIATAMTVAGCTQSSTPEPTPTSTHAPTHTATATNTNTPTVTITPNPTLNPTPIGGGSGKIAFHRREAGSSNILIYSLLDETIRMVTRLDSDDFIHLNASPDGSWLAFWVLESATESDYHNRGSLYIVRPDGRDLIKISDKLLTSKILFYKPVHWTSDSKYLVFNEVEGYNKRFLTIYDLVKGQRKRITPSGYYPYEIKVITNDGWIFTEEYKVKIDGSEVNKLKCCEGCIEFYCAQHWAYDPNDDIIAFTDFDGVVKGSKPTGEELTTLFELDFSENQKGEILQSLPFYDLWQWSPNGNYLFIPASKSEVYIWDKTTDKTIRIPEEFLLDNGEETAWGYNWSPDSKSIFFDKLQIGMFSTDTEKIVTEKLIYEVSTGEIKTIEGLADEEMWSPVWIP